jgi:hypothetical protein
MPFCSIPAVFQPPIAVISVVILRTVPVRGEGAGSLEAEERSGAGGQAEKAASLGARSRDFDEASTRSD